MKRINILKSELEKAFISRLRTQSRYYKFNRNAQVLFPINIISSRVNARLGKRTMENFFLTDVIPNTRVYLGEEPEPVKFSELGNFYAEKIDKDHCIIKSDFHGKPVTLYNPPILSKESLERIGELTVDEKLYSEPQKMVVTINRYIMGDAEEIIRNMTLDHRTPMSLFLFKRKMERMFKELVELNNALWNEVDKELGDQYFANKKNYGSFSTRINHLESEEITNLCVAVYEKLKNDPQLRKIFFDLQIMSADQNSGQGNISTIELSYLWDLAHPSNRN